MADTFQLPIPIDIVNPIANIDARYGPYASVAEACASVPQALRKIGRTVAVLESGKPVEYCWSAGITDADLVKKNYTNGDIDEALASKADKSTTYTKNEVDDAIKSSIASVYKVKGNSTNADLPNKATTAKIGYVYNLTDDGNYGKSGDNIVYIGPEGSTAFEAWDNLGGKVDLSVKEDKSNKLTAFQGTPDDEHYISEKLAKTSLDAKFDKANIVTAFQETPDDMHAASEKLTKESLDKKQDTFVVKTYFVRGSAETKIMPIFALPRINDSILIRYTISVNGQSYSDELRYTASYYNNVYDFFTNANVDFVEHRSAVYVPAGVGMYTKHPAAPAKQITITVLSCTCNVDDIIWYDNTTAALWDKTTIDRNNATVVSKTDLSNAIDLKTNSNGDIIDSLSNVITELNDNQLYTMNAASSNNAFTIPLRTDYVNTQVFCYGDGTVTYNSINYAYYNGALITMSGSTISISDGTKDYYTKSEVTSMLAAKADDSSVVKTIILNGTTHVPASGVVNLGSSSMVVVIGSQNTPVAGMLGHYYAQDKTLYLYNGYNWEMVYTLAQGVANLLATTDAPASANNGTIYYDKTEGNLKIWINGGWQNIIKQQPSVRLQNTITNPQDGDLSSTSSATWSPSLSIYYNGAWHSVNAIANGIASATNLPSTGFNTQLTRVVNDKRVYTYYTEDGWLDVLGNAPGTIYATSTELAGKADDTAVVHKTGDESVDGWKTLTTGIVIGNSGYIRFTPPGTAGASISGGTNNTLFVEGGGIIAGSGNILNNENRLVTGGKVYTVLLDYQTLANLVTALSSSSTDTQYPSAKCVYDALIGKADDTAVVHKTGAETIAGVKTFSDGVVLQSSGSISSGSARAVNGGTVFAALSSKADNSAVVHNTGDETIAGVKSFTDTMQFGSGSSAIDLVKNGSAMELQKASIFRLHRVYTNSERHIQLDVYGSTDGNATYPRLVARKRDLSGDEPATTETTSVALCDDKVSFALARTTEWGFVNATSNSDSNWATKEMPTKNAVKTLVDSHLTDIVITLD